MDEMGAGITPMVINQEASLEGFRRWSLDADELTAYVEHYLKGEVWDAEQGEKGAWVKRPKELPAVMNDYGVSEIVSLISMAVSKHAMLSNLDEQEILDTCKNLNLRLNQTLFFLWKDFELRKEHMSITVEKVMDLVFFTLKRAKDAGEREAIGKTHRVVETLGVQGGKKREGGLLALPGLFKGGGDNA